MAASQGRSPDLAEIFRAHAPAPETLGRERGRVVQDVLQCRTPLLGGHLQVCEACGREKPFYNSCRNRHCPKCQNLEQARWVEAQARSLLPVPYFHVVFTVPTALHPFFLACRRSAYAQLFKAAIGALHAVCQRHLGATPGTIAVLHTWSQTLAFHPHVHCIVTGGGLNATHERWIASRPGFLVPVRVLSRVFRGKLLELFEQGVTARTAGLAAPFGRSLLRQAIAQHWVVYSKPPLGGPDQVLRYLGRYTHRIAIGNERLLSLQDGQVSFSYRDRQHGNRRRTLTLHASVFIRRFLLHVLPGRFVRVRHFGLLANGRRRALLALARGLLGLPTPPKDESRRPRESYREILLRLTGHDPGRCPFCGHGLTRLVLIPPVVTHFTRGP